MPRSSTLRLAVDAIAASASLYLALLVTVLLVQAPGALLVPLTALRFQRFEPLPVFPVLHVEGLGETPAPLYAFGVGGFFPIAALLLAWLPGAVRRARGWLRIFLAHLALAGGLVLSGLALLYALENAGPLAQMVRALGPRAASSLLLRTGLGIAAVCLALGTTNFSLRPLAACSSERRERLSMVALRALLPVLLTGAVLTSVALRWHSTLAWIPLAFALAFTVVAGLPAALRRPAAISPDPLSTRGALTVLAVLVLTLGGLLGWGAAARAADRDRHDSGLLTARGRHWIVHVPGELAKVRPPEAWAADADRRLEGIAARLGVEPPSEPLQAFFYSSTETKEEIAGDDDPFTIRSEGREIHWLVAPDGSLPDPRGDALLLLRLTWGEPGAERLADAVARHAAGTFHEGALPDWAARIAREEEPYPLALVLGAMAPGGAAPLSPLDADALGGAWVEHLRAARGPAVLQALWKTPFAPGGEEALGRALGTPWRDLEKDWQDWLATLPAPPAEPPIPRTLPFLRGISFSHEDRGGYGSDTGGVQLARIHDLGATAVALVPYAFTRAPSETTVHYRGTDESDARLSRTIAQAHRLGLRVMLKPQLWAPGRFTGDITFSKDADFEQWFADYRRWMLHHARLAALERVDLLVIGTELGGLTRVSGHQTAWRGLIRDVRRIYSGPVTYAANWVDDFEAVPFWDALDVLGLNMYYPLAGPGEQPSATSPRLRELRAKLAAMSRRHGKPILFTEVGYAASAAAAVEPWKEDNAPPDPAIQARCYQTVFEAFYREPWLAGLFWWKWPSHGRGGMYDDSFNPLGKPAFQVLERWYGQERR